MTFKRLAVVLGIVVAVSFIAARVGLGGFFPDATGGPTQADSQSVPTAAATGSSEATPASSEATPVPGSTPDNSSATPTAVLPQTIVTERSPLLLLNPAAAAPGSALSITGSGFDPGSTIDLYLLKNAQDLEGKSIGFAQADQSGSFGGVSFVIPDSISGGSFIIEARQENSDHKARAVGQVRASSPVVTFGTQVGKAGDEITISGKGFTGGEKIDIYLNTINSKPVVSFIAGDSGALNRATLRVPYAPAGNNSFIIVGEKSQSPVTVNFLMLNFYPSAGISSYAAKADTTLTFTGTDFGPGERVLVYLNSTSVAPVAIVQADDKGSFKGAGSFTIPFQLKGKNTFIFVGQQTQAAVTASFDVLPYTPYAEASTYGARPGTSITFYGRDFARNEIVRVFLGASQNSPGREVSCFKTDDKGEIASGGGYTIGTDLQPGQLTFILKGDKSQVPVKATIEVMPATGPVQLPSNQNEYVCPFDQQGQGQSGSQESAQPQAQPSAQPQAQPTAQPTKESQSGGQSQSQAQPSAQPTSEPAATPQSEGGQSQSQQSEAQPQGQDQNAAGGGG